MAGVGILELEGIVKQFSDADELVRAVDDVTLTVGPGQVCALYGPSGSGKTTLLLIAAGLLLPDRGAVRFAGAALAAMSPRELLDHQRHDVGFIYQSAHLMSGVPAVENAAVKLLSDGVPLRRARSLACDWLERVGLLHRLEHTPERLSGGERQRVAIARALVNEPRLILADEPTGNLDSSRGMQVLHLLSDIASEREAAVLLVTHDPQAAAVADNVYSMRDGKLVEGAALNEPAFLPPVDPPLSPPPVVAHDPS